MKNLCSNIYVMMSNYAADKQSEGSSSVQPPQQPARTTVVPLDLVPLKRLAEECIGEAVEQYNDLQLQQPGVDIKSEPLDRNESGSSVHNHESTWMMKQCERIHYLTSNMPFKAIYLMLGQVVLEYSWSG
ncbi:hypothetical protein L1987_24784 [Smallanthus sonchifolius]|uniref:Uncharacterized protein n=1 Tax=Smallanthus sonchifolius TaxID=185202 RepID=A0ACB9IKR5_9ASTR|nr:hypothetical protein L1987_24784 [Smallanthus sonchifolius]